MTPHVAGRCWPCFIVFVFVAVAGLGGCANSVLTDGVVVDDTGPNLGRDTGTDVPRRGDDTGSADVGGTDVGVDVATDSSLPMDVGGDDTGDANQSPEVVTESTVVGLVGEPTTFDGSGSFDPDGTIVQYSWTFGDGVTGTGAVADHTYAAAGNYDVTLTVTDDAGASATGELIASIAEVGADPIAIITFADDVPLVDYETLISGGDSWVPGGTIVTHQWLIEGSALSTPIELSGPAVAVTFIDWGEYDVTLTVTDDQTRTATVTEPLRVGASPVAVLETSLPPYTAGMPVGLNGSGSSDPDGTVASYQWSFGDGETASGPSLNHIYAADGTYEVRLTVVDDDGFEAVASKSITVGTDVTNAPPIAEAGPDQTLGVDQTGTFSAAGSTDSDGTIVAYEWDFGDGGSSGGDSVFHAYTDAGTYTVTLTVRDDGGAEATDTVTVTVLANQPPIANAGLDRNATVGEAVSFDASASTDPDGSIVEYAWSFGDGATGSGVTAAHSYASEGTFEVTLTATDDGGASGMDTATITVSRTNTNPTASFVYAPSPPAEGATVQFDGSASSDSDGDAIVAWRWNFGDGTGDQFGEVINHTFVSEGDYTVQLEVTDERGSIGVTNQLVNVTCVTDCYSGNFRVRPFDNEEGASGLCGDFTVTLSPVDCSTTVVGTSMSMTCGIDTYTGTISGGTFNVSMTTSPVDGGICGLVWFNETITGTYVNSDRWEGTSSVTFNVQIEDPFFGCQTCYFDPFVKTGTRIP